VTVSGEHTAEMIGAAAGLHRHDARSELPRQSDQCLPSDLTPHYDRARRVEPNDAADVLAEVDAKHTNIHSILLMAAGDLTTPEGGAGHSIKLPARAEGPSRRTAGADAGRNLV
jgi:hypothetical protein